MYYTSELGTIYYEVHGEVDAPAIVFSHGVAMDHQTFETQVEALKKHYRIIVWDYPYHGKSSSIDPSLRFSTTAADFIIGLLDNLHINKAVLVGQSLGSFVSQIVAYTYPERVSATVHIGGAPLYPKYSSLYKALIPFISYSLKLYPANSLYKAFAKHKALTPNTQSYLEKTSAMTGKSVITQLTLEMLTDMVTGLPEPLKQPMLISYGDHELNYIKNNCNAWHKNTANSQLVEIKNAHHIANQDNPDEFNQVLLGFLKELENYRY